jgi:hypothetical protein
MELEMEEESMSRITMIILGLVVVVVIAILLDVIYGGNIGFVRSITCGIVYYLPGGGLVSSYLNCGVVPV